MTTPDSAASLRTTFSTLHKSIRFVLVGGLAAALLVFVFVMFVQLAPQGYLSMEEMGLALTLLALAVSAGNIALHRYKKDWFLMLSGLLTLVAFGAAYLSLVGVATALISFIFLVVALILQFALWIAATLKKGDSVWIWESPTWL